MNTLPSTKIAELICTRISHDLIGNAGAISNALELMDDDPTDFADLRPILDQSAQTLLCRMKFFRLAFGLQNAAPKSKDEMLEILKKYIATLGGPNLHITLNCDIQNVSIYKILYLGVMSLADVLIRSGTLSAKEDEDGLILKVSSEYDLSSGKLQNIKETLQGKIPEENPALMAPIFYLQSLLEEVGVSIALYIEQREAVMQIK